MSYTNWKYSLRLKPKFFSTGPGNQRGRGRLTRTPIVWDASPAMAAENQPPQPQRGRGGTARRARGSTFFGRGSRPQPKP
jgi:hypothetical protein